MASAYERLASRAWKRAHEPYLKNADLATKVRVLGEPSSGTRLATRMLNASPDIDAWHDSRHGSVVWGTKAAGVVLVKRDPLARLESVTARWQNRPIGIPFPALAAAFPGAPVVHYEDMVTGVAQVIASLAAHFGVEPWSFDELIYDANSEARSREISW